MLEIFNFNVVFSFLIVFMGTSLIHVKIVREAKSAPLTTKFYFIFCITCIGWISVI